MRNLLFLMVLLQSFQACAQKSPSNPVKPEDKLVKKDSVMEKVVKTDAEWQKELTPFEFKVLRQAGTEMPYSGQFDKFFEPGKYYCRACGNYLFPSDTKYNSGCGWPAFFDVQEGAVKYIEDNSHGMKRVEVRCAKCDSHLGHVFEDGPRNKTGLRYCINSVCLTFVKD